MLRLDRMVLVFSVLAFGLLGTADLSAQGNPQTREGFWFFIGGGYGSAGCDECDDRANGASGGLTFGGTINDKVLLGGGTHGWTKEEDGDRITIGMLGAQIRFYPSAEGGFYLLGSLGVGSVEAELAGLGSATEHGVGAAIGLGYDARVWETVSLTPFANSFVVSSDLLNVNVFQLGLGITVH